MKDICGIYKITNLANGKIYIGSSKKIKRRWIVHKSSLRNCKHDNQLLQRAWNKYGENNFNLEIVEIVKDIEKLRLIEQEWINKTNCTNLGIGYNLSLNTVAFFEGRTMSEEHKGKISKANKGRKHSPEAIEKTRQAHIGMKFSPESLKRMSEVKKGEKNSFYGKNHTEETKEKLRKVDRKGSKNSFSKLDEYKVREIKSMLGNIPVKDIANKYNVSIQTIHHIKRGLSWKHVGAL